MEKHLSDKSLLILFAYAPAGFGHLRVTDALYHGLPKEATPPLLLGSQDTSITLIHRIMSTNSLVRSLTVWAETGFAEDVITFLYRAFLRFKKESLYKQMITILGERLEPPTTVLIIATHFGLAHQLAAIKKRLEEEKKIKIILVVQVTDDSPHHIWYVPGADVTFVPSEKTKEKLIEYGKNIRLPNLRFEVVPYPLSPFLNQIISQREIQNKLEQAQSDSSNSINMAFPISGAAVGTEFFTRLIDNLHIESNRFVFFVIAKEVTFAKKFVEDMKQRNYVKLRTALTDQDTVNLYEELYKDEIISLEVTKPSEQAFKALFDCEKRGASILLFSDPVGRQEYDNVDFLRRHNLMPLVSEEKHLWRLAERNILEKDKDVEAFNIRAQNWRGISLPKNPKKAGHFIIWCLKVGLFFAMMQCKANPLEKDSCPEELGTDGVQKFWSKVASLIAH